MNVRLLKKIKKRFGYYKHHQEGYIVVDKRKQEVYRVDFEYLQDHNYTQCTTLEEYEKTHTLPIDQFYFRVMKTIMYSLITGKDWVSLFYNRWIFRAASAELKKGRTL